MSHILHALAFVVGAVWWLPTLLLGLVLIGAFRLGTRRTRRRARRLRQAGRHAEAMAVLERARRETGAGDL